MAEWQQDSWSNYNQQNWNTGQSTPVFKDKISNISITDSSSTAKKQVAMAHLHRQMKTVPTRQQKTSTPEQCSYQTLANLMRLNSNRLQMNLTVNLHSGRARHKP